MLLNTFAAIAQEDSVDTSQHLKTSIRKRMTVGDYFSPSAPYGYKHTKRIYLTESEGESAVVRRIFAEYFNGMSTFEIAERLTNEGIITPSGKCKWRASRVSYILANEKYIGDSLLQKSYNTETVLFRKLRNHGEEDKYYITETHSPIVASEDFKRVKDMIADLRNQYARNKARNTYLLTSKISYSECGNNFIRRKNNGEICWACSKKVDNAGSCKSHYYKEEEINAAIVLLFNNLRFDDKILLHTEQLLTEAVNLSRRGSAAISSANTSIAELNAKLLSIEQLKSKGYLSSEVCQAQTKSVERELAKIKEKRQKMYDSKLSRLLMKSII